MITIEEMHNAGGSSMITAILPGHTCCMQLPFECAFETPMQALDLFNFITI